MSEERNARDRYQSRGTAKHNFVLHGIQRNVNSQLIKGAKVEVAG